MPILGELLGGSQAGMFGSQDSFAGIFSGLAQQQMAQQQQGQMIKFKRYGNYGAKRQLTFIEELREEIDNWLKS